MLARAHLGAHLAAASQGRLDVADGHLREPAGWWPSTVPTTGGVTCRWPSRGRSGHAPGAPEAMARAADHVRTELEEDLTDLDRVDLLVTLGRCRAARSDRRRRVLTQAVDLLRRFPPDGILAPPSPPSPNRSSGPATMPPRRATSRSRCT